MSGLRDVDLHVRIAGTSALTPGRCVTTEALVEEWMPHLNVAAVKRSTGIEQRFFAAPDDTAAALGARALRAALAAAAIDASALERVIFVSSGLGDLVFPATANLVCAELGLRGSCDAFDLNNACLGFLSALDIAVRGIATGSGPVAIVVAELISRCMTPADKRPYLVFGDAVTATVVTSAASGGVLASWLRNDGVAFGNVRMANAAATGKRESIEFTATSTTIGDEAIAAMRVSTAAVLDSSGMTLDEIDWVLPHQPNGVLFRQVLEALGIPSEKTVPVAARIGSTGAAAIPYSLDALYRTRTVVPGQHILMVGVGGGISYGAILYQVPDA